MARRKVSAALTGPAGPALAVLLACRDDAVAEGAYLDAGACQSWLDMLAACGCDPEVAGLFAFFAEEERRIRRRMRDGAA